MTVILVLSPHLDDAAFSVGPLLAKLSGRAEIVVATAFAKTASNLSDFALSCQLDKGISAEIDYMAIRRKEDVEWSKRIGVEALHGAFVEAPHRGYQSVKALFGPVLKTDRLEDGLGKWLIYIAETIRPSVILCPIGLGNHIDHVWVRNLSEKLFDRRIPLFFFKDQPYSSKLVSFCINDYSNSAHSWRETKIPLCSISISKALNAAAAYRTQIPFQFGNADNMKNILGNAWMDNFPLFHTKEIFKSDPIFLQTVFDQICLD